MAVSATAEARPYALHVIPRFASMRLVEFVVNGFLALDVLAVQLFDQLARRFLSLVIRVMAVAEQKLAAGRRMSANAPAAPLMAVEPAI